MVVIYILLAILILGVLIFVHELGHFLFAKTFRVPVETFALGFGPSLFSFKRKETKYCLNVFPLGGYAKIGGMDLGEEGLARGYYQQSWWRRFLIISGGVLFNLIFAWLLILIITFFVQVPLSPNVIDSLEPQYPAAEAGIRVGDQVVSINGRPVQTYDEMRQMIEEQGQGGKSLVMGLLRDGQSQQVTVIPTYATDAKRWIIGVKPRLETIGFWQAFPQSFVRFWDLIVLVFTSLGMLFSGQASISDLAGPVGIIQVTAQFAQTNVLSFLTFVAFLSVNLGVLNFLPIPAFDGARLLFLIIEGITRRRVNRRLEETIHTIGFILVLGLFLYITWNDIRRLF